MKYVSLAEPGGYGLAAVGYLHGLREAGVPLAWIPLFQGPAGYQPAPTVSASIERLRDLPMPPETTDLYEIVTGSEPDDHAVGFVLHTIPELWPRWRQPGGWRAGYAAWETTEVPPHWPELLGSVDRLMTPSTFSAEALSRAGVRVPIDVVPHVPRASSPSADGARFRALHGIPSGHTVFYSVSTWTARKAVWRTLHAYCSAFTARDETTLVVKTDSSGPSHEAATRRYPVHELVRDLVGNYPDAPHVCLIVRSLAQDEVDDLHAAGDCYVSLTHAEGWGLGAFDAACRDKPVVMTGWGGQLDYLSPADAFLVDYDLAAVVDGLGGGSYLREQQWAVVRLDAAADILQWIHRHRDEAAAAGARLGARVRRDFSGAGIITRIRELLGV